jgi:hypothetical protein
MTDDQPADAPRPLTYHQAASHYRGVSGAQERFDELATQRLYASTPSLAAVREPGVAEGPLTVEDHLELIATGEVLARYYRHPAEVHRAVQAGAKWEQVAAAAGLTEAQARAGYREWADGQYALHQGEDGRFDLGLDAHEHAAALQRAAEPEQMEAGS